MRCIFYHPNALHQLFYCILRSTNYKKPALITLQNCGWSLEYQVLSVQHEPWTSFPQETAARSTPAYLTETTTPQNRGWSLDYQLLSVQHEPWTSSPQEPAARSTPQTWLWTSHLGYNTVYPSTPNNSAPLNEFSWKCSFGKVLKLSRKFTFPWILTKIRVTLLHMKNCEHLWFYLAQFFSQ